MSLLCRPSCTDRQCGPFGRDVKEADGSHYCECSNGHTGNMCQIAPGGQPNPVMHPGERVTVADEPSVNADGPVSAENGFEQVNNNGQRIQWGVKTPGMACSDHTECASKSCDEWGMYGCNWKCTVETPSASRGADFNCPAR